ncbi:MAG TPA: NADH-quinone oxidoreductase subunit L [Gammaproteobacteria bacterium]|nr:NADH-quinone oxidoreductase subunit L [Gammaproteobacteria bacterium]
MESIYLTIVLAPLAAAVVAGLLGRRIGRAATHRVTILGVGVSFALSLLVLKDVLAGAATFNGPVYTWAVADGLHMEIGFLVDRLTALMITVVSFVSLMVHIYTIGYMRDDPGYQRFFCYIALFTFSMLMLVMSNNFLQLFFGWEAVGVMSYLLIGFWYTRPTANFASLKAFLVNRVGDFGFLLGIAAIVYFTGSLDYAQVFTAAPQIAAETLHIFPDAPWNAMTVICVLLFIGAMGKSAQVPLHVWLPDSMEGPTPISALIHAATMVTAGIFMVARMSPLFELSETALSAVLVIGATTAFFMGLLGIVQNDIKRVVAYSTLSQLGYMAVALGASAYAAGIFHLMTHAFFKALLFLAAGSVIIALHHEQDMRRMGGLRRYMPITYWTCLIGALALIGFPGTAGFFSKDALIEAVAAAGRPGAGYAHWAVLGGVFVTALYTFRMFFMTFHGPERMDDQTRAHLQESPWVVTVPLVMLAIPSALIGWLTIGPLLFGDFFAGSILVLPAHDVLGRLSAHYEGPAQFLAHGLTTATVWIALAGVAAAWFFVLRRPDLAEKLRRRFTFVHALLVNKYYFDEFNERFLAAGGRRVAQLFWRVGDEVVIDGVLVNGTARGIGWFSGVARRVQSGYLYHYAFAMIIGLAALLGWMLYLRPGD